MMGVGWAGKGMRRGMEMVRLLVKVSWLKNTEGNKIAYYCSLNAGARPQVGNQFAPASPVKKPL